jgi:glycosyltransferase involved in cell wall biosynthesis
MKILICTGIYPPDIGGPAEYAKNLVDDFLAREFKVKVLFYKLEKKLPSVIRHCFYFLRVLLNIYKTDLIIALDTFSVGLPAVLAAKILRKKIIIRTGGDFLWEQYIARTNDLVLLRDFYQTSQKKWSLKEKIIFKLTRCALKNCSVLVFSTEWQMDIWLAPYRLDLKKCHLIENFYGEKLPSITAVKKNFIASARPLKWKNLDSLKQVFGELDTYGDNLILDTDNLPYEEFLEKIKSSYAVILVSLGDISPNFVLDALRFNKPVILTKETGLCQKLKDVVIWVNPRDPEDIKQKVLWLSNEDNYRSACQKVTNFNFTHSWHEIAKEFLSIYKNI